MPRQPPNRRDVNTTTGNQPPQGSDNYRSIANEIKRLGEDYRTSNQKSDAQQHETLKWHKRTAYGVAGYTILTVFLVIIAKCSLDVARDQEVRQLRAYVHAVPGPTAHSDLSKDSINVAIKPKIKAFGVTPATYVNVPWALKLMSWPIRAEETPSYVPTHSTTTSTIAPGEERFVKEKTIVLSRKDVDDIVAGSKRIIEYGTILYMDVFGCARFSNFCISFTIDGLKDGNGEVCPIHNDTDWASENNQPSCEKISIPAQ